MERYMMVLKSYKRMPKEMEDILRQHVHPRIVSKHEIIQAPGAINDQLYFVEKGLMQLYCLRGKEQLTLRFKKEDEWMLALKKFYRDGLRESGIEALEDGVLWCIPGALVDELESTHIEFGREFDAIVANELIQVVESGRYSREEEGSENFDFFRKCKPELVDRAPIPQLANLLSMPEKMLEHLRKSPIELKVSTQRRRARK